MARKGPIQPRPISQYVVGIMRRAMQILEATEEAGGSGEERHEKLHSPSSKMSSANKLTVV